MTIIALAIGALLRRSPREFLVLDPMWDGGIRAEPAHLVGLIVLEVALEPLDVAVALEGEHVGRDAIEKPAIVADDDGAAGEVLEASSRARRVSTSRSLVGSSSRRTLAPDLSILARCTRLRSPPESVPTFFCWSAPLKLKALQ